MADRWLAGLLGEEPKVALVAVGGYGRSELCPGSDLDVVLVHDGRRDIKEVADRIWYPVWDAGVGLDHSVRTLKEALRVAESDLKVALGLLDARLVAGDADLAATLAQRARDQWRKRGGRWLEQLGAQVAERHHRFGEVAFLLEPDLKEGKGGLRDVHALHAAGQATHVLPPDAGELLDSYEVLLAARVELHRIAGRAQDRLVLEQQDAVAEQLGYSDADALMAAVATAARAIGWASDDAWHRVASWRMGPKGRTAGADRQLGPGLLLRDGEVALAPSVDVASDAGVALRAGAAAATAGTVLARTTLERLVSSVPAPREPWPPSVRDDLLTLLGAGHAAIPMFEALDQYGLIERLLPEWSAVRNRPQRNAYHRFTVDRHLCETAANASALSRDVERPDLLLIGAWLHDLGKGYPGDHTAVGVELMQRIATRMGFPPDDVTVLCDLVRHHLLLADVATRRDLDDPRTAETVAEAVGRRDTLELLAALTEADGLATGPAAWSDWKAGLVADLARRAASLLAGTTPEAPSGLPTEHHIELMARGELVVDVEGDRVTVVAPDRAGLFARVAGALAIHGMDVRAAAAAGNDDMAVEVFEVAPAFGQEPDWDRIKEDIARAIAGRLSLQSRLGERARTYGSPRAAAAEPAHARVLFDNEAASAATVVEVRAADGVGVLYRITRALADCDLDIRSARVSTLGHEVVDAFYVCDDAGQRITDPEHQQEIERAVLAELARPW